MALTFDTSSSYVALGDDPLLTLPDGDYCLGGFFKQPDHSGSNLKYFISWGTGSPRIYIAKYDESHADGDKFRFTVQDDGGHVYSQTTSNTFTGTDWYHIFLERSGTSCSLYVDNNLEATEDDASVTGTIDYNDDFTIGNYQFPFPDLNGALAEWAKWDRLLTPTERANLASGYSPLFYDTDLKWYSRMLNTSDTNELINGLTLTMNNVASTGHPSVIYPTNMYWVNGSGDNIWSQSGNWAGIKSGEGGYDVPSYTDNVYFTDYVNDNCDLDTSTINIANLYANDGYTGDITSSGVSFFGVSGDLTLDNNFGHFNMSDNNSDVSVTGDVNLDCTEVSMGNGNWTLGGNFIASGVGTLTDNLSTVIFTGIDKEFVLDQYVELYNVTISSGASISLSTDNDNPEWRGLLDVSGTLNINGQRYWGVGTSQVSIPSGGTISGDGRLYCSQANDDWMQTFDGDIDCLVRIRRPNGSYILPGYYKRGLFLKQPDSGHVDPDIFKPPGGEYRFGGPLTLSVDSLDDDTLILDLTNGCDIVLENDLIVSEGAGDVQWNKGTGTITCSGNNSQNVDFNKFYVEDVVINKDSVTGLVTFGDNFYPDSFVSTKGTCDFNGVTFSTTSGDFTSTSNSRFNDFGGCDITVSGDLDINGIQDSYINFAGSSAWNLTVTGEADVKYANIAYCDASSGTGIRAIHSYDSGNNTNVDFPVSEDTLSEGIRVVTSEPHESGGQILTDNFRLLNTHLALNHNYAVSSVSSFPHNISQDDYLTVYHNNGYNGISQYNLPEGSGGLRYIFVCEHGGATNKVQINATNGAYIRMGENLSNQNGNIYTTTSTSVASVLGLTTGLWVVNGRTGLWGIT